jgi:hypothetical protein
MAVALWGLVSNRVTWLAIPNRKVAGAVLAGSFVVMGLGGAMGPKQDEANVSNQGTPTRTTDDVLKF